MIPNWSFAFKRSAGFPTRVADRNVRAPSLRHQPVRQFVFVIGLARKVSGEDISAAFDGFAERVAGLAGLDAGCDHANDLIPRARRNFLVDTAVGEHLDAMFEQRDQNQNAGVISGVVEAVFGECGEASGVNRLGDAFFWG